MALVIAVLRLWVTGWPGGTAIMFAVVFGALMAASWIWPIMLYIDDQSDAFDLDEGFFVLLILLVPAAMTVLVFAVVAVVAQAVKRRPLVKSAFNVGPGGHLGRDRRPGVRPAPRRPTTRPATPRSERRWSGPCATWW